MCDYFYLCAMCGPDEFVGQKRMRDSLELEWQMVVSCHVSVQNETQQVHWKAQFSGTVLNG